MCVNRSEFDPWNFVILLPIKSIDQSRFMRRITSASWHVCNEFFFPVRNKRDSREKNRLHALHFLWALGHIKNINKKCLLIIKYPSMQVSCKIIWNFFKNSEKFHKFRQYLTTHFDAYLQKVASVFTKGPSNFHNIGNKFRNAFCYNSNIQLKRNWNLLRIYLLLFFITLSNRNLLKDMFQKSNIYWILNNLVFIKSLYYLKLGFYLVGSKIKSKLLFTSYSVSFLRTDKVLSKLNLSFVLCCSVSGMF